MVIRISVELANLITHHHIQAGRVAAVKFLFNTQRFGAVSLDLGACKTIVICSARELHHAQQCGGVPSVVRNEAHRFPERHSTSPLLEGTE